MQLKRRRLADCIPVGKKRRLNNNVALVAINNAIHPQRPSDVLKKSKNPTDIGSIPIPLADALVPFNVSPYIADNSLVDTDSKLTEPPKDD